MARPKVLTDSERKKVRSFKASDEEYNAYRDQCKKLRGHDLNADTIRLALRRFFKIKIQP